MVKQSFETVRLKSGELSLRWKEGGETFHPDIGAEEESRVMIVEQLELARRFSEEKKAALKVWDVGLGAAGNAAAILGAWRDAASRPLHLISFDSTAEPLELALRARREDPGVFPWLGRYPAEELLKTGKVRLNHGGSFAGWDFCRGDFAALMAAEPAAEWSRPDLIVYDFFSPRSNYDLWSLRHWRNVRRWLDGGEGTEVVFHSRSTALRVTLLLAGFYVARGVALGGKEETTVASGDFQGNRAFLDRDWLGKVPRSASAEPFAGPDHRPAPISPKWLEELRRHPQFAA